MAKKRGRPKKVKKVQQITREEGIHMTGQDLVDEVAKQTTLVASLKAYNTGLRQRLADAMAANNGVLSQAQLDQVFADVSKNDTDMADAMVENVPPNPGPVPNQPIR